MGTNTQARRSCSGWNTAWILGAYGKGGLPEVPNFRLVDQWEHRVDLDGIDGDSLGVNGLAVDSDGFLWVCGGDEGAVPTTALFWKVADDGSVVDGFPQAEQAFRGGARWDSCRDLAWDPTGAMWATGLAPEGVADPTTQDMVVWRLE